MKKNIDFSCKHNILLQDEDGTLRPMDEPYFKATLIAPGTWSILSDGDYSYLVEGDDEALVIDSGYGCGNIREFCQTLTDKPVKNIANTHFHFDHTANNCYFDCAYMSAETRELATIPFRSFEGINFPRDYPVKIIGEGYVFHLGNRDLETFSMPDHAVGSLAFLDRKERLFFSGDEIVDCFLMTKKSVEGCLENLKKFDRLRGEFDRFCAGPGVLDISWLDKYISCAEYILAGHDKEGGPVTLRQSEAGEMPAGDRIIFMRRQARSCDMRKPDEDFVFKRQLTYNGCTMIYDSRKIRD